MSISMQTLISQCRGTRILVVGDIIVDHFIWGSVSRISPEAPVPVVNVTREETLLGGGANVVHNIFSLGGEAVLCGIIGNDAMGDRLEQLLMELGAPVNGLVRGRRPTTVKTRVVAQGQQVVRFDREQTGEPLAETVGRLTAQIDNVLGSVDAVIVSDYYKGVISRELMRHLLLRIRIVEKETGRMIPVVVDPKPGMPERFTGATIITPNHLEAEKMTDMKIESEEDLVRAGQKLRHLLDCKAVLITRGEQGMALLEDDQPIFTIPTMAREVFDVTGAGDTVIAALALGLGAGAGFADAASLANVAAGIVVGKVGTATVSSEELLVAVS